MNLTQAIREYRAFCAGLKADFGKVTKEEAQTAAAKFWEVRQSLPTADDKAVFAQEIQRADPALFDLIKAFKDNPRDNTGPAHPGQCN